MAQLPAYIIPENAMLNFRPLDAAVADYTKGLEVAGKSKAQLNAANAMQAGRFDEAAAYTAETGDIAGAMALRQHPLQMQALQDAQRERETRRIAGQLQGIAALPDGDERRSAFQTWLNSDPRHRNGLVASGLDPNSPDIHMRAPNQILSEALGPRDPLAQDLLRAQAQHARQPIMVQPGATAIDPVSRQPVFTAAPRPREMSVSDIDKLRSNGTALATSTRLLGSFDDAYAMPGSIVGGDIRNWLARNSPDSLTTPSGRAAATWWQDYYRNSELTERHELFGSALTSTEQAAWRAAAINPNMNPTMIRNNLETRDALMRQGVTRYARSLVAAGYDASPVAEAFGIPPQQLGIQGGGRRDTNLTAPTGGPPAEGASGSRTAPVLVDSIEAAQALPPGHFFRGPDGLLRQRPAR